MNTRIKKIRQDNDLTMDEFGEKIHLSKQSLSGIEKGNRNITDRVISDICSVFHVNREWLETGEGDPYIPESDEHIISRWVASVLKDESDSYQKRFIHALTMLSDDQWNLLEPMSDYIASEHPKEKE